MINVFLFKILFLQPSHLALIKVAIISNALIAAMAIILAALLASVLILRRALVLRGRELNFRSGILQSANTMLEELLEEKRINEVKLHENEEAFKSLFLQSTDPMRNVSDELNIRKELIQQKTFIQTVLDNLPIGVAINEIDSGKASYMNKKFMEIYGWPEELLGDIENFFTLVYPDEDYRRSLKAKIMDDIASGDIERMKWDDITITTATGAQKTITAQNIPLPEQNIMVSTVFDTTFQSRKEIEIKKERDRLELLFSIAHKIGESDSLEDLLKFTMQKICEATGWSLGEAWLPSYKGDVLVYGGTNSGLDPLLEEFTRDSRDRIFEPGIGIPGMVWLQKKAIWIYDLQANEHFVRKAEAARYDLKTGVGIPVMADESVVCVLVFLSYRQMEKDENLIHLVSSIGLQVGELFKRKSILDKQQFIMDMLRKSDFQLKQAQKIAHIGSWEFDFTTNTVSASEQAKEIYGLLGEESMSIDRIQAMVVDKYRPMLDQSMRQHRTNGTPYDVVFQIQRASDGQLRYVHSMAEFNIEQNKLIGIIRDVTESKTNELLKHEIMVANESARFKQKFLAQMSHEIRTPLTAIEGMIELIEKTRLDETQSDFLETVKFSADNLKNIINEVLDYSRIEAGGISLNPVDFSPEELFSRSEKLFNSISKDGISLDLRIKDVLPPLIRADKHRVFQIITNLLSNAVKYAGKSDIALEIELLEAETPSEALFKVSVHDQGPGISPFLKKKLFKPFSQIHSPEDMPVEGTGLGLSICKELAKLLGGEIDVDSTPGEGSTFWFTFKAIIINNETLQKINKESEQKISRGLKILLAEDKQVNQKVISLILSSLGHHITLAGNGWEAIEKFDAEAFDLVLMDIQMPQLNGVEATCKIKETHPNLKTPIVGLSANATPGDREKYMEQGLDEYITKPVRSDDFRALIKRLNL